MTVTRRVGVHADDPALVPLHSPTGARILVSSWEGDQSLTAVAAVSSSGEFALALTTLDGQRVAEHGVSTGPVEDLADEIRRLMPLTGDSPPAPALPVQGPRAGEAADLSYVDVLLLRDLLLADDPALPLALEDLELRAVPAWVAAISVATGGVGFALDAPEDTVISVLSAVATPTGWWQLQAHPDDRLSAEPLCVARLADTIVTTIATAATWPVSGADRSAPPNPLAAS